MQWAFRVSSGRLLQRPLQVLIDAISGTLFPSAASRLHALTSRMTQRFRSRRRLTTGGLVQGDSMLQQLEALH
jgi:hypothetical protein